jgi:hypothetical protein
MRIIRRFRWLLSLYPRGRKDTTKDTTEEEYIGDDGRAE